MDPTTLDIAVYWAVNAVAIGSLGVLIAAGALREQTLAAGPSRDLGLPRTVYICGALLTCLYVMLMLTLGATGASAALIAVQLIPFALIGLMIGQLMRVGNGDGSGFYAIGLVPTRPRRDLGWALAAAVIGFALAGAMSNAIVSALHWLGAPPPPQVVHKTLETLRENFSQQVLISVIVSAVILAPLLEELVFRGILQTSLLRLLGGRRWPALLLASAIFALTHGGVVTWHGLLPLMVIGLVFGYVYERTGSLLAAILTHALFNAANIAIAVATMP